MDRLLFEVPAIVDGLRVLQLDPALCVQLGQVRQGQAEGEFKSSIQTAKDVIERRKPAAKIIWEVTRPWRQLVHFFSHSPLQMLLRSPLQAVLRPLEFR